MLELCSLMTIKSVTGLLGVEWDLVKDNYMVKGTAIKSRPSNDKYKDLGIRYISS